MRIADLRRQVDRMKDRQLQRAAPRRFLIPPKPRTDAEREDWKRRFRDQQLALVASHRRQRLAIEANSKPDPISPFPVGVTAKLPRFIVPKPWKAM